MIDAARNRDAANKADCMEEAARETSTYASARFGESVLPPSRVQPSALAPLHDDDQLERMAAKSAVKRS